MASKILRRKARQVDLAKIEGTYLMAYAIAGFGVDPKCQPYESQLGTVLPAN